MAPEVNMAYTRLFQVPATYSDTVRWEQIGRLHIIHELSRRNK